MLLDVKKNIIDNPNFDNDMARRGSHIRKAEIEGLYRDWRDVQDKLEMISCELNSLSKNFTKDKAALAKELSQNKAMLAVEAKVKHEAFEKYMLYVPNLLDENVVDGKDDKENVEIFRYPEDVELVTGRHHEDILQENGWLMKEEAVQMSGSRFVCLRDKAATLERRLVNFAIDMCRKHGFMEMSVPALVRRDAMQNAGQLPKFDGAFFEISHGANDEGVNDYCLIPTGEISLANLYSHKSLQMDELPIKMVTLTSCFRREAGSLGRDTKGLIRLHQFNKVEMFIIADHDSDKYHQEMLGITQEILKHLKLPYRIVSICSGDTGFTAARQYDVEVWMPGQGKYVEVASVSNCWEFQSRRMNLKYKADGVSHFAHTLNGTAIAAGRIIAAMIEHGHDLDAVDFSHRD